MGEAMQLTALLAILSNYFARHRAAGVGAVNFTYGVASSLSGARDLLRDPDAEHRQRRCRRRAVDRLPGSDSGGNQCFLDPMQLVQFAPQHGDTRWAFGHWQRVIGHALDLGHHEAEHPVGKQRGQPSRSKSTTAEGSPAGSAGRGRYIRGPMHPAPAEAD